MLFAVGEALFSSIHCREQHSSISCRVVWSHNGALHLPAALPVVHWSARSMGAVMGGGGGGEA
jgi:hypothetical protein